MFLKDEVIENITGQVKKLTSSGNAKHDYK